jgi:hypothetical protein
MKLDVNFDLPAAPGDLVYRSDEYSFDTLNRLSGVTSLLINDIQLEVTEQGAVSHVWGLCDHPSRWQASNLTAPIARGGALLCPASLTPGVSIRLNDQRWAVRHDTRTGWIAIGDHKEAESDEVVEFQSNCRAVLRDGELVCLWLKPRIL